jgi:hypothetical protein
VWSLALMAVGCQANDGSRELQEANDRIAQLESELAPGGSGTEPVTDSSTSPPTPTEDVPTEWRSLRVPRPFTAGQGGLDRPDSLLATLAAELIDLSPGGGGDSATLRLREKSNRVVGYVLVDELPDDSVRALEFRATLEMDGNRWHVGNLAQRQICRRGGSGDVCT